MSALPLWLCHAVLPAVASRSFLDPCFKVATLGDVKVMFADIRKTLQLLVEAVPLFHDKMEEWHDKAVRCALYFDEVQAGNILAPLPSKKAGFFYLGFPDFGVAWRNSPRAWVTLGMLPYLDHQKVPGGYTAYLYICSWKSSTWLGTPSQWREASRFP